MNHQNNKIIVTGGTGYIGSINDVLKIMGKIIDQPATVNYCPKEKFDVSTIYRDDTRAQTELSWFPKISLDEGISKTWEFVKSFV